MDYIRVMRIPQYFRNLRRLGEIVTVLARHGFGDFVQRLNIASYLELGLKFIPSLGREIPSPLDTGERLRLVCEELGPTFIKFGQLATTRPDIFPAPLLAALRKLQDKVQPFPSSDARKIIADELGHKIEDIFSSFNDTPAGSASIAQVHQATLIDGAKVVVKVQRPALARTIDVDVDILRGFAELVEENIPESRNYNFPRLVEEFSRTLKAECDFRREAQSMKRFAAAFKTDPGLIIPHVYESLSTEQVLTEEFIDGIKADDLEELKRSGIDTLTVAQTLNRVILKSIFEERFFHADPHPGNVIVTRDNRVSLIDFGAMGRLDRTRVTYVLKFLVAIFSRDTDGIITVLHETEVAPAVIDEISLKNQVSELLDVYLGQTLGALDVGKLLSDVFEVTRRYGIRPPPDLLLVGKAITTAEYLGVVLDPAFDPLQQIRPYLVKQYLKEVSNPLRYARAFAEASDSWLKLMGEMPGELRLILQNLGRDRIVFNLSDKDLERKLSHQDRLLNRAIMTLCGLVFFILGLITLIKGSEWMHPSGAWIVTAAGAILLFFSWLAVRRSGGC